MKFFISMLVAAIAATTPAVAQTFVPQRATSDQNPEPRKLMCWNGSSYESCPIGVSPTGAGSIDNNQVSIGTGSTLLVAARTGRKLLTITTTAANTCAFGKSGVTLTTGFVLQPVAGATLTLPFSGALYGACSAATTVAFAEIF